MALADEIDPIEINSAVNQAYGRSGSKNIQGLDPDLSMRLAQAQDAYRQQYGEELPVTSGVRTRSQQQQLFNARKNNPNLVAAPGTSKHETGNAIDIDASVPDSFLNKFGLYRPLGAKDPVHTQVMPNVPSADSGSEFQIDPKQITQAVTDVYKNPLPQKQGAIAGIGQNIKEVGQGLAGLADVTVGNIIPAVSGAVTYAGSRALGSTSEEAASREHAVVEATNQPFGKAFGITSEPGYKNEIVGQTLNLVGQGLTKAAQAVAEKTGLPVEDIQNMINTGLLAVPELAQSAPVRAIARPIGKAVKAVAKPIAEEASMLGGAVSGAAEPVISRAQDIYKNVKQTLGGKKLTPEEAQAEFEAKGDALKQYSEEQIAPSAIDENAPYSELKYSETSLPVEEQYARAQTLAKVLGPEHEADMAAIAGNGKERATNYQLSNTDTPQGNFLKQKFEDEANRLNEYAENQVASTGGSAGLDESAVYRRGHTILDPLKGLEDYFNEKTRAIYAERDAMAKDIPVLAENIKNVLEDKSLTLMNTDSIGLANAAKARLEKLGMLDKEGNPLPTNAETAENFRKFVNENWDPKNRNLHRSLKEAVDQDVLANIDQNTPLYKDARDLYALRKNTLDNPKGISNILEAEGPNGINRKVDIEKIAPNIVNMPVDQFTHVIDTLRNMPPELQPRAEKALGEIKAQFANNIAALVNKSAKNPTALTKYMNDNKEVMSRVFSPEEMQNFRDLHNAAQILKTNTGYPGAAAQKINIEQRLLGKIGKYAVGKGVVGAASTVGGPVGAIIANEALSKASNFRASKLAQKAEKEAFEQTQSKFIPLSDLLKGK